MMQGSLFGPTGKGLRDSVPKFHNSLSYGNVALARFSPKLLPIVEIRIGDIDGSSLQKVCCQFFFKFVSSKFAYVIRFSGQH
jgi:hypothetical protein